MTPVRPRGDLSLGDIATPLGPMLFVCDAAGVLVGSDYADHEDRLYRLLGRRLGGFDLTRAPLPPLLATAVTGYFAGDLAALDRVPVRLNGSPFQNLAWAALRRIPPGQCATYAGQAARIGRPKAARAVGSANHMNPYNLILPCHRVVGANGALTGYAGGLERKRWLLDHESRHAPCTTSAQ